MSLMGLLLGRLQDALARDTARRSRRWAAQAALDRTPRAELIRRRSKGLDEDRED